MSSAAIWAALSAWTCEAVSASAWAEESLLICKVVSAATWPVVRPSIWPVV